MPKKKAKKKVDKKLNGKCHLMLIIDRDIKNSFKSYAALHQISMTAAISALMTEAVKSDFPVCQTTKMRMSK